ncbi:MAG: SlyX family protein [Cellvibrionaceae bacterium]
MSHPSSTEVKVLQQQIDDLQSRLAHQEDMLQSLNKIIVAQDKNIIGLNQQLQQQQNKLDDVSYSIESSGVEKPPHY